MSSYAIEQILKNRKITEYLESKHIYPDGPEVNGKLKYLCPIHDGDTSPSFYVYTKSADFQNFYCYSCKAKYNIIHLFRDIEKVSLGDAIRSLGFTYRELEEMGITMPVVELNVQYYRPALYDNLITVKTILKELPDGSKIQFHSELYNEDGVFLNKGVTTLVFYDAKEKKKINMPQVLVDKLSPFFNKDNNE